jgi:hypothetical protein
MIAEPSFYAEMAKTLKRDLLRIGIELRLRVPAAGGVADNLARNPANRIPVDEAAWFADYPSGSEFFPFLFYGRELGVRGTFDFSLLGASPSQLDRWGYSVHSVPTADPRIAQCNAKVGSEEVACWAELDKFLMENVVPWVPYFFTTQTYATSSRVVHYSFDQSTNLPALDQIALKPGSP